MNGAHDLGGMMGLGPVAPEPDEPAFHHGWEKRALAITLAAAACGRWNLDMSRHARETLPPVIYLSKSYYEIWTRALEKLLLAAGMVSADELQQGAALSPGIGGLPKLVAGNVAKVLANGSPSNRPARAPALFAEGDTVRTKVMNPTTHTRLPRYARGKTGRVVAVRDCFVFPNSNAHCADEDPRWCYNVRFTGRELWGADADPSLSVSIDAWEPYVERA